MTLQLLNKIEAWHKVEFLTPYQLKWEKNEDYVISQEGHIPWLQHEKYRLQESKDDTFRFKVYLGVMDTEVVMQAVREYLRDDEQMLEDVNYRTSTAIAELGLDVNGIYISGSFKLSTLPFALGKLKAGDFYNDWFHDFSKLHVQLNAMIQRELEGPVTLERLQFIQQEISDFVGWRSAYSYFIAKCKRVPRPKHDEKDQSSFVGEPHILNSFYIKDLEMVRNSLKAEGSISEGLREFLSGEDIPDEKRHDIHHDKEKLVKILSPANIPLGRWPGNPGHSLNLMQQAAVNQILKQLKNSPGVFSVNGPPGTGKTTLLRDVIAEILVQRAERLIAYDDPKKAFSSLKEVDGSSKKVQNSFVNALSPELCGFGIVVASSNNGAVENISKELPDVKAIHESYLDVEGAEYFRDVAQRIHGASSWGMISAILGKSGNRHEFNSKFLDREKHKDKVGKSYFNIHDECKAISEDVHLEKWKKARESFLQALSTSQKLRQEAVNLYDLYNQRDNVKAKIKRDQDELDLLTQNMRELHNRQTQLNDECNELEDKIKWLNEALEYHKRQKFGFFVKLFRLKRYREHLLKENRINKDISEYFLLIAKKKSELKTLDVQQKLASAKREELNIRLERLNEEYTVIDNSIMNSLEEKPRVVLSVHSLLHGDKDSIQKSSPWITKEFSEARSKLFLAAMHVHECFIRASASKIIGNIILFSKINSLDTFAEKDVFKPVWDVFSLLVPVVSTSFASVSNMFRGMKNKDLGWLIIDEAGQAVPQAAVGAIWRSERTVVVGDPIQIEPVVRLPKSVFSDIRSYYKISPLYLSEKSSVQSLMDLSNKYGTFLLDRWIGSPLWVHRRCVDPMFTICNEIAYDGKMVLATESPEFKQAPLKPDESMLVKFLKYMGPSSWYQVRGEAEVRQYVPLQGQLTLQLVKKAFQFYKDEIPSLFIITPFTAVKEELKTLFRKEYEDITSLKISKRRYNEWINGSIGTVHTFQGKEAAIVIFCLGVDEKSVGSALWATKEPNLVNVAVSRAKYRFYVVCDENIWGVLKNMNIVKRELTFEQSPDF
ncbi:ATP-binding protein [Brevibacillus porteri]|uniref:AAA domain-containing protein n=1 Tax=Brevibacillus porteri TaxID=2126350 RepID=UPI003D1A7FE6